jgi:signal transduction histidine kinase
VALLHSLQFRLLAVLVLTVAVALTTVAYVARASTTAEFESYVEKNRQEMQDVARQIAASTGDRLVVTNTSGRVIIDSSGELVGQVVGPDKAAVLGMLPPPPGVRPGTAQDSVDVMFVRRSSAGGVALRDLTPTDQQLWTKPVPAVSPFVHFDPFGSASTLPVVDDREAIFVAAVTRSLIFGVLVGAGVAVALALLIARGILQPVSALTTAARRMEHGDLTQRVQVRSRDEIGQLAHAFNAMADAIARTELLRRTMVTDIAHELRTPLTNLRGYLEAIRDGVAEPRTPVIETLYEEAILLSQLVDDLQDLTLSEAGQLTLRREPLDVHGLLLSAAQALQPRALEQRVDLIVQTAPRLPLADADPQRIGQVLRNLLDNALTHTGGGGSVQLTAALVGDSVRIEVRDTGCGIPPEHVANVFERFYRVDRSRARATGGAGIGLAVVRQLVEAHGGTVGVTSTLGRGSCFSFTLPVLAMEPELSLSR